MPPTVILILIIGAVIVFFSILLTIIPVGLWISAIAANVKVGIFTLVGMRLKKSCSFKSGKPSN